MLQKCNDIVTRKQRHIKNGRVKYTYKTGGVNMKKVLELIGVALCVAFLGYSGKDL